METTTFNTKHQFNKLSLKDYKYNIKKLNQDIDHMLVDLHAVGNGYSNCDIMIHLFMAYEQATNEDFITHTRYLRSEYSTKKLTKYEVLMQEAESKYDELVKDNKWKSTNKKSDDENIVTEFLLNQNGQ